MHLPGLPMSIDSKDLLPTAPCLPQRLGQRFVITIQRVEFWGLSSWRLHFFHAPAPIADSTDEQLTGYPGGPPARMQLDN